MRGTQRQLDFKRNTGCVHCECGANEVIGVGRVEEPERNMSTPFWGRVHISASGV